jgi:hypothetical protein
MVLQTQPPVAPATKRRDIEYQYSRHAHQAHLSQPSSLAKIPIVKILVNSTGRIALPNPSLKRSANGRPPPAGRWYAVHFHRPAGGGLPSSPA